MDQKNTFSYTYSAQENQKILDIRNKYLSQRRNIPIRSRKEVTEAANVRYEAAQTIIYLLVDLMAERKKCYECN